MRFKKISGNHWNITLFFIGLSVIMFVLNLMNPEIYIKLFLLKSSDLSQIYIWQFFTYIFYTDMHNVFLSALFFGFKILVLLWFCSALEALWGSPRFLIFFLLAVFVRSISAFLIGPLPVYDDLHLYICLMVAFGFNFPDNRIYVFFFPVRLKVLAIVFLCAIPVLIFIDAIQPGFSNGLIYIPRPVAALITGSLSYVALLVFFNRIFTGNKLAHVVNKLKETKHEIELKKSIETISEKNRAYKELLNKKDLSDNDKKVLSGITDDGKVLCEPEDFDESAQYCLGCDKYKNCVKRKIDNE